jgi:hypothetical protein
VVLSAGDVRQAYKITVVRQVPHTDLVDDEQAFDIGGPPRLVLITCAGEFRPERGGYSRNLIVVAHPGLMSAAPPDEGANCEELALINQSAAANDAEGPARWSG